MSEYKETYDVFDPVAQNQISIEIIEGDKPVTGLTVKDFDSLIINGRKVASVYEILPGIYWPTFHVD